LEPLPEPKKPTNREWTRNWWKNTKPNNS